MPSEVDVIVVGASCAGLTTARDLAEAGLSTVVLDSRADFAEPERTWIVTEKLRTMLGADPEPSVVHRTGVMELDAPNSRRRVELARPDLIVERGALRRLLADAARAAGADIRLGHRAREIDVDEAGATVRYANGAGPSSVRGRHLVGADGVRSVVADAVGAEPQRMVPIVQARVRLPADWDPDVTKVWFDPSLTRFFYWLIPESDETGVLGLIAETPTNARRLLEQFLDARGYAAEAWQGAMIPLHQRGRRIDWRIGDARVVLVGDAAAHVKVTTVGGVVSGVWGARAAARCLRDDTSYLSELSGLRRELLLHDTVRWFMDHFRGRHYDRLLDLMNPRLDALLGDHDRDSLAPRTAALLAAQPKVLALGVDALDLPRRIARGAKRLLGRGPRFEARGERRPGVRGAAALEPGE